METCFYQTIFSLLEYSLFCSQKNLFRTVVPSIYVIRNIPVTIFQIVDKNTCKCKILHTEKIWKYRLHYAV